MISSMRTETGPNSQPPLERILCAVDLAHPHRAALELARSFAERLSVQLEAVYVRAERAAADSELAPAQRPGSEVEAQLRGLGLPTSASVHLAYGRPAAAIVARATAADLIVLGCTSRPDLGWQFRDDVARDVSAAAPCATLTVNELDRSRSIERILVPVDFGPGTSRAVGWALAVALRFQAKVQLLHVVSREQQGQRYYPGSPRPTTLPGAVALELGGLEHRLAKLGVDVRSEVVVDASTARGIESYHKRSDVDLVVMSLGRAGPGSARLTRGVAATLRSRLPVPLLSVSSRERSSGGEERGLRVRPYHRALLRA